MRICKNRITDDLRRLFNANPLKIPEALYQPLLILEIKNGKPHPIGQFKDLIKGTLNETVAITTSDVAEFSGLRTKKIGLNIGLKLLDNFSTAFGLNPINVKTALNNTKKIEFSFSNIKRKRFSLLELGKLLSEHDILADYENMIIKKIMNDSNSKLAIVTDCIISNNFTIDAYKDNNTEAEIDVSTIKEIIDPLLNVSVTSSKASTITFKKENSLTFAFCCVEIFIDDNGKFSNGDWLTKIKSRNVTLNEEDTVSEADIEFQAKIMLDNDEASTLLIENV